MHRKRLQLDGTSRRRLLIIYIIYVIAHRYIVCVRVPIGSTCLYSEGERERQPDRQTESEETEIIKTEYLPILLCE